MEILFTPFLPLLLLFFIDMDIFFLTSRRAERYFHQSGISFPPSSSGGGRGEEDNEQKRIESFYFSHSLSVSSCLSIYLSYSHPHLILVIIIIMITSSFFFVGEIVGKRKDLLLYFFFWKRLIFFYSLYIFLWT